VSLNERIAEATRLRPIFEDAVGWLERFLALVTNGYTNKPEVVDRNGHEVVRFVTASPCDAALLKFARVVSLNRAMLLLLDNGFIQEQAIIQRSIEETNEDIMYICVNITESGKSDKFHQHLDEFWKEDYEDPNSPMETRIPRGFSRKGITAFLNRVFGLPNPSLADEAHRVIFSMYSGFIHGASPHIMELYDFDKKSFLTNGLLGTNRHLDYVIDANNSIYRSLLSAAILSKALGSKELLKVAMTFVEGFEGEFAEGELKKKPD
jgi:hypothetical protein